MEDMYFSLPKKLVLNELPPFLFACFLPRLFLAGYLPTLLPRPMLMIRVASSLYSATVKTFTTWFSVAVTRDPTLLFYGHHMIGFSFFFHYRTSIQRK